MDRRGGGRGRGRGGGGRGGGRREDSQRSIVTTKLFVGNLPPDITSDELREYFEKYGSVTECDVVNEDFGFVHFGTPEEADAAVDGLNQTDILGSRIRVQKSTSSRREKGSGGGDRSADGGCFKCGESGHWSKECPNEGGYGRDRGGGRAGGGGGGGFPDPYDNPLIERYRRTIDSLHERIRYLEDLLAARPPAVDPYARPAPDYYERRPAAGGYDDVGASSSVLGGDMRSSAGKMPTYLSDSPPPYRARPY